MKMQSDTIKIFLHLCISNCLQKQRCLDRRVIQLWKWKELYCSEKDVLFMLLQINIFVNVILVLQPIAEGHFQKQWDYTSEKHLAKLELSIQSQSFRLGQMEHVKGVNDDMSRWRELSSTDQLSFAATADWKFLFCAPISRRSLYRDYFMMGSG